MIQSSISHCWPEAYATRRRVPRRGFGQGMHHLFARRLAGWSATGWAVGNSPASASSTLADRVRVLRSAAVIVFLIGLISEQVTSLTYRRDS